MERDQRVLFAALLSLFSILIILLGWSFFYDAKTKFVAGTESGLAEPALSEPTLPSLRLTDPTTGSSDSRVPTIAIFSDFTCTYCRLSQGEMIRAISQLKKPVRVVWRDLPISSTSREAMLPALGGRCAHAQQKFWEFHDAVFAGKAITNETDLKERASQAGLNLPTFNSCIQEATYLRDIQKDVVLAHEHLILTSPTFFIGNQPAVSGYISSNQFMKLIQQASSR
jgi:protein-disulfide isomerase